ncbi:substrate-binding periplasmic protein [Thalassotalea fusca]
MIKFFFAMLSCYLFSASLIAATDNELRIVTEHFPPLQISDKKNNKLEGMAVDVMRELLTHTQYSPEIEVIPWARAYELALVRPNTLIFTIIRTEERDPHFKWVGSISPIGVNYIWTLKSRTDIHIENWQDAIKYNAVAQRYGAQSIKLKNHGFQEQKNLYLTTTYGQGIKMVLNQRADFFLGSDFLAGLFLRDLKIDKSQFNKLMPHSQDNSLNIAFNKQTPDSVVNEFRQALEQMKQNGSLEKIVEKWTK